MKRKNFFLLAAMATALIGLPSCSSDETAEATNNTPAELKITASVMASMGSVTRAGHDIQSTSLIDYDNIGIYVWYSNLTAAKTTPPTYNGYANDKVDSHTADATATNFPYTLTPTTTPMYFPVDNHSLDVYLYTPYNNSFVADADMVTPAFTVSDDQSGQDNYVASDFLYGKATANYTGTNEKTANVTMYHALSKIIFKVVPASGVTFSSLTELKLTGVKRTTKIRMANPPSASMTVGSATTNNVEDAYTGTGDGTDVIVTNTANFNASSAETNGVAAIIPPQALTALGVSCEIDGKTSSASLSGLTYDVSGTPTAIGTFLPGKVYTITLNIKTGALDVKLVAIHDWEEGNGSGSSLDLNF